MGWRLGVTTARFVEQNNKYVAEHMEITATGR